MDFSDLECLSSKCSLVGWFFPHPTVVNGKDMIGYSQVPVTDVFPPWLPKEHLEESNIKGGQVLSISYACPLLMSSSNKCSRGRVMEKGQGKRKKDPEERKKDEIEKPLL